MSQALFTYSMPEGLMQKHHCSTVVIACIDFRFREANDTFIEKLIGSKDFDTLNFPGGGKNLVSDTSERASIVQAIQKVCIGLHEAKRIVVMNHWDCGAYGGSKKFTSASEEEALHRSELEKAKEFLKVTFPDLEIVAAYNKLAGDSLEYYLVG